MADFPNLEKFNEQEIYFMKSRAREALIDAKGLIIQLAGQDGIDDERLYKAYLSLLTAVHELGKATAKAEVS